MSQPRKPLDGQETRGKTARNRLRRVDLFALLYDPSLIKRPGPASFVDLGYGAYPFTVLESAARLRELNPELKVIGVEIDPERVAEGRPYQDALTEFRLGGFNIPLRAGEKARLIRAFNVLRQYDEPAVLPAHHQMIDYLIQDGLLLEGTSNPFGQIWVSNVIRRTNQGGCYEALVFSTNFRLGFDPADFQPVLPKNFIHRMVPNEPIFEFMDAWKTAYRQSLGYREWGPRQLFVATAVRLADMGWPVETAGRWLQKGFLIWRRHEAMSG